MVHGDLVHRFAYHPPVTAAKKGAHETVRGACLDLAVLVNDLAPEGREKSLAITKIEEAMMWANAAIARGGDGRP